ncbi:MAG: hypothetical protein QW175_05930 [Candidatus Bathyarchaeia archaeon]
MEKQVDLTGQPITVDEESPDVAVLKSALQKSIRRGYVEKAMTFALQLLEKAGWYVTWRRLRIIATEDCGTPEAIMVVETLYRMFLEFKGKNSKELSWDAKRCVVSAALIMAESPKDRRADEFLELWDAMEKKKDVKALQSLKELWTSPPDEAYDMHTPQGRKRGRGLEYWYSTSSKCENMTEQYAKWREWWEGLMLALCRKTENQNRYYPTNREKDEKTENKMHTTTTPEEE